MEKHLVWIALALSCLTAASESTNNSPQEPTFESKPVTHWVDCFSLQNLNRPDSRLAPKAMRTIGVKGAPWIIRYAVPGYPKAGKYDQPSSQFAVRAAFRFFSESDKRQVDKMIPGWLQDANPQVRANAISLLFICGMKDPEMLALLRLLTNDPDARVQRAIRDNSPVPNWRDNTDDALVYLYEVLPAKEKAEAETSALPK